MYKTTENSSLRTRVLLWTLQTLLALLFLFAGGMKLLSPSTVLAQQAPLPPRFLMFIGLAEVAGALGLVLPGLFRIGLGLTSLAAAGLVLIMAGATVIPLAAGQLAPALIPAGVGLLLTFVAYKRRLPGRAALSVSSAPARPALTTLEPCLELIRWRGAAIDRRFERRMMGGLHVEAVRCSEFQALTPRRADSHPSDT